jgi:hypothetical protein
MARKRIVRGVGKVAGYLIAGLVVGFLIFWAFAYYAAPVTAPLRYDAPSPENVIPAP